MNYYFIDFENIKSEGLKEIKRITKNDELLFFYTENCKNISLEIMEDITKRGLKFKLYKAKTGTKNALDFQLSSYLGYVLGQNKEMDSKCFIISNDKGYDCICDFWKEQNVYVERVGTAEAKKSANQKNQPKKSKSKVEASNLATIEEIKKYLSDDEMPNEVLQIFNQYKTKQAICNGISKKCKDSKRTSAIYKKLKPLLKEKKKS